MAFAAQRQVQAQGHLRALGVVADGGVGRVLVLAVVLVPGVEAGLCHALHAAPGHAAHGRGRLGQQLGITGAVDQAAAHQGQVVEIGGEALEEPQQLGVVLFRMVDAAQLDRLQALHIPGVEILVADETQQGEITIARGGVAHTRQILARGDQGGAGAVLQPPVAVFHRVEHEHVLAERSLAARTVPEADVFLADALRIAQQAFAVEARPGTGHHELVLDALRLETAPPEGPDLEGMVHEFVVVIGLEMVPRPRALEGCHGGGHVPSTRHADQAEVMGLVFTPVHAKAQAGVVEETPRRGQKGRAHRGVEGVDLVLQDQGRCTTAVDLPRRLVQLLHGARRAPLARLQAAEVAPKFAHHVAAGNPHRQAHHLSRIGLGYRERDAVGVVVGA